MVPFFTDYLERLDMLHNEMDQALSGLSQAALDCALGPEINSLAVLATHVAGSEMYWIGDMIIRRATIRSRASEFQTIGIAGDVLRHAWPRRWPIRAPQWRSSPWPIWQPNAPVPSNQGPIQWLGVCCTPWNIPPCMSATCN